MNSVYTIRPTGDPIYHYHLNDTIYLVIQATVNQNYLSPPTATIIINAWIRKPNCKMQFRPPIALRTDLISQDHNRIVGNTSVADGVLILHMIS